jgi:hypothetical protein
VASVTLKLSVISSTRHGRGKRRAVIAVSFQGPGCAVTEEAHTRGHGLRGARRRPAAAIIFRLGLRDYTVIGEYSSRRGWAGGPAGDCCG